MRSPTELSYDVIVVGGGPGGSTVSTLTAMCGHRVLLLESQVLPVYKIGESLLPATIHGICPLLGVGKEIENAGFVPKRGGTFCWGRDSKTWSFDFSASSYLPGRTSVAYQVERMKFDLILLNNARAKGVEVREGCAASGLVTQNGRVEGVEFTDESGNRRKASARYVIDASGHQSPFARHAGERIYSDFFRNVALFGYFRGAGRLPAPNQGNIFCAAFEHGWFWFIPLSEDLTSVGAVVSKDRASLIAGDRERAIRDFIRACPPISSLLDNAARAQHPPYEELRIRKDYSYANTRFWVPGLALIGDAACFIDPIFSSGVHLSTYSALQVARSVNTFLDDSLPEEKCFGEFEARYRREYALFYDFLIAFYDLSGDQESYYWQARRITNSPESNNNAFINLVAGIGGSGERLYFDAEEFLDERRGLGAALFPQGASEPASGTSKQRQQEFYSNLLSEVSQLQLQASLKEARPRERPLFSDGLVASRDGLHWTPVDEV